jgi:hypothetical protein
MYICYTILILMLLCIISMNLYNYNNYLDDSQKINRIIRQTARWATAADQDTNAYISNLHATYAVGYLMALREIYTDEAITRLSNVDVRKLDIHINKIMDDAVKKLIQVCPEGQPKNKYLAYLSKEGGY